MRSATSYADRTDERQDDGRGDVLHPFEQAPSANPERL
jgi:hypothetical protein